MHKQRETKVAVRILKCLLSTCQPSVILKKILTTEQFFNIQKNIIIVHFQRDYDYQTWAVYTLLRENVGSYPSQSGIGTQCPDFDKYSYILFWWGYRHQMSAADILLGEESSGHLSPGTSDVITMQSRDRQIQIAPLQKRRVQDCCNIQDEVYCGNS